MKYCSKCHQVKPRSEYYRSSASWDGYRPDCKECHSARARKWWLEIGKARREAQNSTLRNAGAA